MACEGRLPLSSFHIQPFAGMPTESEVLDKTMKFLFADEEELNAACVPKPMRERLKRLRSGYTYWNSRTTLMERDIIQFLMKQFHIAYRTAWDDVRFIKICLGNLNQCSREYKEWLFQQRFEEAWLKARDEDNPAKTMASLLSVYTKAQRLDKDEAIGPDYSTITPQQFEITSDVTVAGFERIPNVEEKARKMLARYQQELVDVKDVEYEEVDSYKKAR